jgi:hypothetical protein
VFGGGEWKLNSGKQKPRARLGVNYLIFSIKVLSVEC